MTGLILLAAVTALYAGYNLFVKLSGAQIPAEATTTVLAAISIQLAALSTSRRLKSGLQSRLNTSMSASSIEPVGGFAPIYNESVGAIPVV